MGDLVARLDGKTLKSHGVASFSGGESTEHRTPMGWGPSDLAGSVACSDTRTPVLGPGAIGGAVAGALIEAGHEPLLAVRTRFESLVLTTPEMSLEAAVQTLHDPEQASRPICSSWR
ncbi:MAG: 2-dehydropantoate 2-reductase N-terminal domain-containing protein [Acidimicrobiales bacterium]